MYVNIIGYILSSSSLPRITVRRRTNIYRRGNQFVSMQRTTMSLKWRKVCQLAFLVVACVLLSLGVMNKHQLIYGDDHDDDNDYDSRAGLLEKASTPPPIFNLTQSRWSCQNKHDVLRRHLDCRRRLPHVIGIGAKKSGTTATIDFLSDHPSLASPKTEIHHWDWHPEQTIERYRLKMPITSQYQITMEESPAYFVADDIPSKIAREVSSDVKLIVILRDPVKRAISDYAHVIRFYPHMLAAALQNRTSKGRKPKYPHRNITYTIKASFEKSVMTDDGAVNSKNALIVTSMYSLHLQNWLSVFSPKQMHIVDGDAFMKDPLPHLQAMESFLGLPKYFDADKLRFNEESGFYCLASGHCTGGGGGDRHHHPAVHSDVLMKLRQFYQPYDKMLTQLTGRTFSWMST